MKRLVTTLSVVTGLGIAIPALSGPNTGRPAHGHSLIEALQDKNQNVPVRGLDAGPYSVTGEQRVFEGADVIVVDRPLYDDPNTVTVDRPRYDERDTLTYDRPLYDKRDTQAEDRTRINEPREWSEVSREQRITQAPRAEQETVIVDRSYIQENAWPDERTLRSRRDIQARNEAQFAEQQRLARDQSRFRDTEPVARDRTRYSERDLTIVDRPTPDLPYSITGNEPYDEPYALTGADRPEYSETQWETELKWIGGVRDRRIVHKRVPAD